MTEVELWEKMELERLEREHEFVEKVIRKHLRKVFPEINSEDYQIVWKVLTNDIT